MTDSGSVLVAILLAGVMGMVGQGARAVVGLKSMTDEATAAGVGSQDIFRAARLLVSLMIGFIAGIAAAFVMGIGKLTGDKGVSTEVLLGLAAAGYTGADVIEAFMSKYLSPAAPASAGATPARIAPPAPSAPPASPPRLAHNDAGAADPAAAEPMLRAAAPAAAIAGTSYPSWALARDVALAHEHYWDFINKAATAHDLPVAVICAIGSKESQWGLALRPPGSAGTGDWTRRDPAKWGSAMPDDGLGWGRGLMQIDWYSHPFARTGNWRDAESNIMQGCAILAEKVRHFGAQGMDAGTALRCGVSAYNGRSGPHSSYSDDVMARADWISQHRLDH